MEHPLQPLRLDPDQAIVVFTRMPASSLKTTTRVRRGRRCSLRRYDMIVIPLPGITISNRPRAYAYADGDLSYDLSKIARSGSFTAVIAYPFTKRCQITAIVDHDQAIAASRAARNAAENAEWDAAGAGRQKQQGSDASVSTSLPPRL